MMITAIYLLGRVLFFLLAFLVFYTYLGYGVLTWLLVRLKAGSGVVDAAVGAGWPDVTLVVPAYNELAYLPDKLKNCLEQDYAAMNQAMRQVSTPITIFTDANTQLNREAVSRLTRRFEQAGVGAVTGEKRISTLGSEAAAGSGEGLYWRYESFLKKLDAQLHTIVGAAGELFAIRTSLYEPVESDTLLDDFMISLRIAGRGYRVDYAPDAYALERPSHSVAEEMKRKVRIAAGGFQAIRRLGYLFNISKYGWLTYQYVSHRVLRWAVTPFCLPLLLLLNIGILTEPFVTAKAPKDIFLWQITLVAQFVFYFIAYIGYRLENRQTRWKLTFVPFYFVFMNWCVLLGFARFRNGNLSGVWEKSKRAL